MPVGKAIPEDEMKAFATAAITVALVVGIGCGSFAYETDFDDLERFDRNLRGWKIGRGFVNILLGPYELFTNMTNNAIKGAYYGAYDGSLPGYVAGATNGYIAGIGPGMYKGLRRMTTGALEILTFWKPEYGPTVDPQWGTRDLTWPEQDYFDPDPFWYNGPER